MQVSLTDALRLFTNFQFIYNNSSKKYPPTTWFVFLLLLTFNRELPSSEYSEKRQSFKKYLMTLLPYRISFRSPQVNQS